MEPRDTPFTWVTWVAGLLSGDKHCQYAVWLKSHFWTTRRAQSDEDEARLRQWAGDHADLVQQRRRELEAQGWAVRVEKQNKFILKGRSTTLSGCPDIVATREVEGGYNGRALDLGDQPTLLPPGGGTVRQALVEDAKTGQPRDSDFWQVAIYALLIPTHGTPLEGRVIDGAIAYKDRVQSIPASAFEAGTKDRIVNMLRDVGGSRLALPATPSFEECKRCDIAECTYRMTADTAPVDTEAF